MLVGKEAVRCADASVASSVSARVSRIARSQIDLSRMAEVGLRTLACVCLVGGQAACPVLKLERIKAIMVPVCCLLSEHADIQRY